MDRLTPSAHAALAQQVGFIRYLRDLPTLRYHFSKQGPEGWAAMVSGSTPHDPNHDAAWALWLAPYGLPEFGTPPLHPLALYDLAVALRRGLLPRWALACLEPHEIKQAKEVKIP